MRVSEHSEQRLLRFFLTNLTLSLTLLVVSYLSTWTPDHADQPHFDLLAVKATGSVCMARVVAHYARNAITTKDDNRTRRDYRRDVEHVSDLDHWKRYAVGKSSCCCSECWKEQEEIKIKISLKKGRLWQGESRLPLFKKKILHSAYLQYLQIDETLERMLIHTGDLIVVQLQTTQRLRTLEDTSADSRYDIVRNVSAGNVGVLLKK